MKREQLTMGCFQRASPALKEILLQMYRAERPIEIDHHLHEFGSVEYHIQSSATDPNYKCLSISTTLLSHGALQPYGISAYTMRMIKDLCFNAVEIVEPPREGYQLTLKLNFDKIRSGKDPEKIIQQIAAVQAVILSSQLKEMLENVNAQDICQGTYKPFKLVYHPREPFYVIKKQPRKFTAVFPMRFKEPSDVIIATAFFQELVDVGNSEKWAKAPPCSWSPIPPPELRGEPLEDLSTNGGFVCFDISPHHVEGKKLDKTIWSLLNFYACVKNHVKILHKDNQEENEDNKRVKENSRFTYVRKLVRLPKSGMLKKRCREFARKIKRIRFRIKIHGFQRFRRRWLTLPSFSSPVGYAKLD
ncbi:actin-related protein 2/3 complex subunit 2B isoform X2 [Euphorbia lathyris]|uniref:actin-related protein 2/3 complex subunit 2B isoform X2 n=1 Tax=Euphorbia lathyris TaxID=212925 RepID=UPI003313BFBB